MGGDHPKGVRRAVRHEIRTIKYGLSSSMMALIASGCGIGSGSRAPASPVELDARHHLRTRRRRRSATGLESGGPGGGIKLQVLD